MSPSSDLSRCIIHGFSQHILPASLLPLVELKQSRLHHHNNTSPTLVATHMNYILLAHGPGSVLKISDRGTSYVRFQSCIAYVRGMLFYRHFKLLAAFRLNTIELRPSNIVQRPEVATSNDQIILSICRYDLDVEKICNPLNLSPRKPFTRDKSRTTLPSSHASRAGASVRTVSLLQVRTRSVPEPVRCCSFDNHAIVVVVLLRINVSHQSWASQSSDALIKNPDSFMPPPNARTILTCTILIRQQPMQVMFTQSA